VKTECQRQAQFKNPNSTDVNLQSIPPLFGGAGQKSQGAAKRVRRDDEMTMKMPN